IESPSQYFTFHHHATSELPPLSLHDALPISLSSMSSNLPCSRCATSSICCPPTLQPGGRRSLPPWQHCRARSPATGSHCGTPATSWGECRLACRSNASPLRPTHSAKPETGSMPSPRSPPPPQTPPLPPPPPQQNPSPASWLSMP